MTVEGVRTIRGLYNFEVYQSGIVEKHAATVCGAGDSTDVLQGSHLGLVQIADYSACCGYSRGDAIKTESIKRYNSELFAEPFMRELTIEFPALDKCHRSLQIQLVHGYLELLIVIRQKNLGWLQIHQAVSQIEDIRLVDKKLTSRQVDKRESHAIVVHVDGCEVVVAVGIERTFERNRSRRDNLDNLSLDQTARKLRIFRLLANNYLLATSLVRYFSAAWYGTPASGMSPFLP